MKNLRRVILGMFLLFLLLSSQGIVSFAAKCWKQEANYPVLHDIAYDIHSSVPIGWHSAIHSAAKTWNAGGANFNLRYLPGAKSIIWYWDPYTLKEGALKDHLLVAHAVAFPISDTDYQMVLNSRRSFSIKNDPNKSEIDVQGVVTHEFGHWAALDDLHPLNIVCGFATMSPYSVMNTFKMRVLSGNDLLGLQTIHGIRTIPPVDPGTAIRDRSLVSAPSDDRVYWIQNGKRYHVIDPSVMAAMTGVDGWGWNHINEVSAGAINSITYWADFISPNRRSAGILIREIGTDEVYYVESNGTLRWITYDECVSKNCWNDVIDASAKIMSLFRSSSFIDQGSTPVITGISAPEDRILRIWGTLSWEVYFHDPDGDIVWIQFKRADGSISGEWDPDVFGHTSGTIKVKSTCDRIGVFPRKIFLFDAEGNVSNEFRLGRDCRSVANDSEYLELGNSALIFSEQAIENLGSRLNLMAVETEFASTSVTFTVKGIDLAKISVRIFDLSGKQIFAREDTGSDILRWDLLDVDGGRVPNGVYLYIVTGESASGEIKRSDLKKLIVLN